MNDLLTPTFGVAIFLFLLVFVSFAYIGVPLWLWSLYAAVILGLFSAPLWLWIAFGVVALVFNIPQLRQRLVTTYIVRAIAALKLLPKISDTEREAIEAGNVWVDGEFFSGKPNFKRLLNEPYPSIPEKSRPVRANCHLPLQQIRSFLDNQVETVCQMATDWEIHCRKDLPPKFGIISNKKGFLA